METDTEVYAELIAMLDEGIDRQLKRLMQKGKDDVVQRTPDMRST